ncbi:MAG: Dabb family protein [Acidobacteria bacterium]|nr:Dabb family protein [Acidobacteriota bacterium]
MVFHIVLFRPKPDITDFDRQAMFEALKAAASGIPAVRRFHVGCRITHGSQYEQLMRDDYPYAAVVEFDDLAGLQAYLRHPQHATLGALFYELLESGLVYDYQAEPVR